MSDDALRKQIWQRLDEVVRRHQANDGTSAEAREMTIDFVLREREAAAREERARIKARLTTELIGYERRGREWVVEKLMMSKAIEICDDV